MRQIVNSNLLNYIEIKNESTEMGVRGQSNRNYKFAH